MARFCSFCNLSANSLLRSFHTRRQHRSSYMLWIKNNTFKREDHLDKIWAEEKEERRRISMKARRRNSPLATKGPRFNQPPKRMAGTFYEARQKYFGEKTANFSDETTEEEIKSVYDERATNYDKQNLTAQVAFRKPLAQCLDDAIKKVFQEKTKDDIKIIDAGAGTGLMAVELQKLGYTNLHALDISQEMLNEAKKKNVYKKIICAPLNDQRIPEIETGEFDAMICGGTLIKGNVRSLALVEMVRMVRTDGLLCFNVRVNELDDYQGMMLNLEKAGKWSLFSKKTLPYFAADDMPKETLAFVYKVLKN